MLRTGKQDNQQQFRLLRVLCLNCILKNKIASSWGGVGEGSSGEFVGRFCCGEKQLKCGEFSINRESTPEAENTSTAPWEEQPPESPESMSHAGAHARVGGAKHL